MDYFSHFPEQPPDAELPVHDKGGAGRKPRKPRRRGAIRAEAPKPLMTGRLEQALRKATNAVSNLIDLFSYCDGLSRKSDRLVAQA